MDANSTKRQISDIIALLIRAGLSDHQKQPALSNRGEGRIEIGIPGAPDLASSMKALAYGDIYLNLLASEAYHLRMIDGSLIQMLYVFRRRDLLSHRLAFFPAPSLEMYESLVDSYERDEVYSEIVGDFSLAVPIRFDYCADDEEHIDVDHPRSHLTLGQYQGCRIPVQSPLTPLRFMRFILRNFYNPAYGRLNLDAKANGSRFLDSITPAEQAILHLVG